MKDEYPRYIVLLDLPDDDSVYWKATFEDGAECLRVYSRSIKSLIQSQHRHSSGLIKHLKSLKARYQEVTESEFVLMDLQSDNRSPTNKQP